MADNFGGGVSRVLDPKQAAFLSVLWQQGKPPLDADLNLMGQLDADWRQQIVLRGTPSGWIGNDTNSSKDFVTNSAWSNWFQFGRQRSGEKRSIMWAVVNGWVLPVTGTQTGTPPGSPNNTDTWNKVTLDPPPANSGDFRSDFVFLEVWQARVPASPSTLNKPSASAIFRYGNVEGGFSYLADDIQDPAIGAETTQRVQLQYRIRVVKGLIGLATYPDGFDPSTVKARGAGAADTSFSFTNMRQELGDPGLWRAGDGTANSLGTVDGYVYAIPLCVVFRRNGVAWTGDPSQNLNGGFNRNPTATDRTGVRTFSTVATLASPITASASTLTLVNALNIPLPSAPASPVLIQIGDELLTYTAVTGSTVSGLTRGTNGTIAEAHPAGRTVKVISGRPDGLFSDQIAQTDILDLRHVVNPNGFDYHTLLQQNLDRLLKGQLRSNWKRSGAGPQGSFVFYQDKISAAAAGLGITKVDSPDGIRMIYSDAAVQQKVEVLCTPFSAPVVVPATQPVGTAWSLTINAVSARQRSGSQWDTELADNDGLGDRIRISISQFKNTVPGADGDQVRLLNEVPAEGSAGVSTGNSTFTDATANFTDSGVLVGDTLVVFTGAAKGTYPVTAVGTTTLTVAGSIGAANPVTYVVRRGRGSIEVRVDGQEGPLPQHRFKITPSNPTPADDVTIEFAGAGVPFPIAKTLYVTTHVQYGAGRGLSRRPDSIHNISVFNPNADLLVQPSGVPQTNFPLRTAWALLWSKYRNSPYKSLLPVTAEAYADLGSKTAILTPFRRVAFPATPVGVRSVDGAGANARPTAFLTSATGASAGTTTFTDLSANFTVSGVVANDVLVIESGLAAGRYRVLSAGTTTLTTDRALPAATGVSYQVFHTQGLMPLLKRDGVTAKWATTDPLGLFSGTTDPDAERKNFFVTLPRHLVPSWGEVYAPVLPNNGAVFHRGLNFMLQSREGLNTGVTDADHCRQYINYTSNVPLSFAAFSTGNFSGVSIVPSTFNSTFSFGGVTYAGSRFFTDQRGLGRRGIELPPFYGIARLWAVYEAADYKANGSGVNPSTREPTGAGAKNLLRQNFNGPAFWIEIDDDGDSTFILNAEALDLSKSPTPIATFDSRHYVIEASVFGFDRGSFDLNHPFRLVLSRERTAANTGARATNTDVAIFGPVGILPGPMTASDTALVNYSRTPYQGDPWGSQSNYVDSGYNPGSLTSAVAYQIISSRLDLASLTRPNQKPLEVLASIGFVTSLGTGRLSGDPVPPNAYDFRNVGYEDQGDYPPVSAVSPRPDIFMGALDPVQGRGDPEVNPEYLGCVERLPLGSLFRDKDFKGQRFTGNSASPVAFVNTVGAGYGTSSQAKTKTFEQDEIPLMPASLSAGFPGEVLVHVDGEVGNYSLLTNFRTARGGSVFVGGGDRPGGDLLASYEDLVGLGRRGNVLVGRAFLVRNSVTTVGANESSAGDELMMLVATMGMELGSTPRVGVVNLGTNGTGEGLAAADLYRIEGHPMIANHTKYEVDPNTVVLSNPSPVNGG